MANRKLRCRICTKVDFNEPRNIFEKPEGKLLLHIKQLTGVMLKNKKYLPQHICSECFMDLRQARAFRRRCLKAQNYFTTSEYKTAARKECDEENKQRTIDIKVERAEEDNFIGTKTANSQQRNESMETTKSELLSNKEAPGVNENDNHLSHDQNSIVLEVKTEEVTVPPIADYEDVKFEFKKCEEGTSRAPSSTQSIDQNNFAKAEISNCNKGAEKEPKKRSLTEHVCEQCGNLYTNINAFRTHLNRHAGIKPFECENCPSKFYTRSELKIHTLSHTGERSYECRYCSRRFSRSGKRLEHERVHTNERPYKCTYCPKDFRLSCSLKDHLLTHTKERNFECTICNKYFQRPTHLVAHNRSKFHKENADKQNNLNKVDLKVINMGPREQTPVDTSENACYVLTKIQCCPKN